MRAATATARGYEGPRCFAPVHLWMQLSFRPIAFPQTGLRRFRHGTSMVLPRSLGGTVTVPGSASRNWCQPRTAARSNPTSAGQFGWVTTIGFTTTSDALRDRLNARLLN